MKRQILWNRGRAMNQIAVLTAAGATWMGGSVVQAANATWLGTTDAAWAGANWSASPVPGTGDIATFSGSSAAVHGNTTLTIGAITVHTLLFDSANAAAYTFGPSAGAGTVTLNNGGSITVNAGVMNDQLFNANLSIATATNTQSATLTNNSAQRLILAGTVSTAFSGVKTLNVGGSGDVLISGSYNNGSGSNLGINKTGSGTLTLSGTNNASGVFAISSGTLVLNNTIGGNAINGGLALSGGTVRLAGTGGDQIGSGNAAQLITINAGTFDLNGRSESVRGFTGAGGIVTNTAANTTSVLNSTQNQVSTYAGDIVDGASGTGVVALVLSQNTKTLSGSNSYSGGTSFNGGNLLLGSNTALGTGALTFTAGGTLRSDSDTARVLVNNVASLNGAVFGSVAAGQTGNLSFGPLNHASGTLTVHNARTTFAGLSTSGTLTKAGLGALEIQGAGAVASTLSLNGGIVAIGGAASFGGSVSFNGGALGLNGSFTRTLGGSATQATWQSGMSGGLAAYGGDLSVLLNNSNAVSLTWAGNGASNRFVSSGVALVLGDSVATGTVDLQNSIDLNAAAQTVLVHNGAAAIDAKLSGILSNGGLMKTGAGTLELANVANTYTGDTTLSAGTLLVNGSIADSNVIVNGGVLGGAGTTGDITLHSTGVLAPGNGNGIGVLSGGDITFGDGSRYQADIGAGAAADQIAAGGALDLASSADALDMVGAEAAFDGSPKAIAIYGALVGMFDIVTLNGQALVGTPSSFTVNGFNYRIDYGSAEDKTVRVIVVPEPALFGFAGLGVASLLARQTRRRR